MIESACNLFRSSGKIDLIKMAYLDAEEFRIFINALELRRYVMDRNVN